MKINYDKIFQVFSDDANKNTSSTSYDDIRNHPIYYLGMYKKLISYTSISQEKIKKYLKNINVELGSEDISNAGKFISCNKAWNYISKFNINDNNHISSLIEYGNDDLKHSLIQGISYFEECTEYEKCAFLKKILDLYLVSKNN